MRKTGAYKKIISWLFGEEALTVTIEEKPTTAPEVGVEEKLGSITSSYGLDVINILDLPETQWTNTFLDPISEALDAYINKGDESLIQNLVKDGTLTREQADELLESKPLLMGGMTADQTTNLIINRLIGEEVRAFIRGEKDVIGFEFKKDSKRYSALITKKRWDQFLRKHVRSDIHTDETKIPESIFSEKDAQIELLTEIMRLTTTEKGRTKFIAQEKHFEIVKIFSVAEVPMEFVIRRLPQNEIVEIYPRRILK